MARTRISITIPGQLVEAADVRAAEVGRSRSWVLAEALRAHLAEARSDRVQEASPVYVPGLGPSRLAQLEADVALTPEERVALAEETVLVSQLTHPRRHRDQILLFDSIEDFHAWERCEAMVG